MWGMGRDGRVVGYAVLLVRIVVLVFRRAGSLRRKPAGGDDLCDSEK